MHLRIHFIDVYFDFYKFTGIIRFGLPAQWN